MQDIEFTIEDGVLWMLQTRTGKRTAPRRGAHRRGDGTSGLIERRKTAVRASTPEELDQPAAPAVRSEAERDVILAKGLPASPGRRLRQDRLHGRGRRRSWKARRAKKVILVRNETSPEDVGGMHAAEGILTATGGMTSHAAVVARGMGKVLCRRVRRGAHRLRQAST